MTTKAFDASMFEELAKRLAAAVPNGLTSGLTGGLTTLRDDLEQNFRAILQSGLGRLDLVTRREFDVQAGVLKRTREKLEQLEARLTAMESRTSQSGHS